MVSPGYVKTELSRNAITDKVNLSADQQVYKSGNKGCCTWGNGSEHRERLQCRLGGREGVGGYAKGRSGGEASFFKLLSSNSIYHGMTSWQV